MLNDPQSQIIIRLGKYHLVVGWFRMDEGFNHMQIGTLIYKGTDVLEYGLYLGILAVYLRLERPFSG